MMGQKDNDLMGTDINCWIDMNGVNPGLYQPDLHIVTFCFAT